jgi:hypothetical protein
MVVKLSDFLNTSFSTFSANDTNNTGITYPGAVVHNTTLTPGVGIGAGLNYQVETSNNNIETGMTLETVTTDVTAGSEDFDFVVKLMQNGAAASERFRISSAGIVDIGNGTGAPSIEINGAAATERGVKVQTNGTARWDIVAGSGAESGSGVGSNFEIQRHNDAGAFLNTPFSINRGTGGVYIPYIDPSSMFGNNTISNAYVVTNAVANGQKAFIYQTGGVNRWLFGADGTETGANTGANMNFYSYSDAGVFIEAPFIITRATGRTNLKELRVSSGNLLIGRTDSTVGLNTKLDVVGAVNASAFLVNGVALTSGGGGGASNGKSIILSMVFGR